MPAHGITATGIEIAGITFGSALQRQASETRIEGQAQAEIACAVAARESSDLQARGHKILGMQAAAASRAQSLGAIAGGYALALQMNEAQRQAATGLIAQSRDQQVIGILADRSFGGAASRHPDGCRRARFATQPGSTAAPIMLCRA